MDLKLKERDIKIIFILILFLAFFMRFYQLDAKPLHFDEGMHWYTNFDKIINGIPINYYASTHAFFSLYLSSIPLLFTNPSIFVLRLTSAIFAMLLIIFLWPLKKYIGNLGLLTTSIFIAVSPSIVYYSRFSTSHYPVTLFLLLLCLISLMGYFYTFKKRYVYLFFISLALSLTTHEISLVFLTGVISFVVLLCLFKKQFTKKLKLNLKNDRETIIISFAIFCGIIILIMSSFLTNFSNLNSYIRLQHFLSQSFSDGGHNKGTLFYINTLFFIEMFAFLGSFLYILFLRRKLFHQFILFWFFFGFVFLSIISYKILWNFTIVLLPMYILSGLSAQNIYEKIKDKKYLKITFFSIIALLFLFTFYTSIKLNYIYPTGKSDVNPLNYVGPVDDNYRLYADLENFLKGKNPKILFALKGHWPMNYYLRNYTIEYVEQDNVDLSSFYDKYDMIIIKKDNLFDPNKFSELGTYELRENFYIKVLYKKAKTF